MKRFLIPLLNLLVAAALMTACKTPYVPVKTLADVGLEVRRAYADAYVAGLVPPDIHAKALKADAHYLQAQRTLRFALEKSKEIGEAPSHEAALAVARDALLQLLDIVSAYVAADKASAMRGSVLTAKAE